MTEVRQSNREAPSQSKITRREAIKAITGTALGILTANTTGINPASAELRSQMVSTREGEAKKERVPFQGDLSFGIVRGPQGSERRNNKTGATLERLEEMLQQNKVDVVLTPEYSFYEYDDNKTISLEKTANGYKVGQFSNPEYAGYINRLQDLARKHKTHIFAATVREKTQHQIPFDPFVKNEFDNTLLHIDPQGEIIGIKKKTLPPQGDFNIEKDGRVYKTLPIICGEIWQGAVLNIEQSKIQGTNVYDVPIQSWMKDGNYDLLLHPQEQSDVYFNALAKQRQGMVLEAWEKDRLETAQKGFHFYYDTFIPLIKKGAPIITADINVAAAMTEDGPMTTYIDTDHFAIGGLKK